jgi:hypothetical protein
MSQELADFVAKGFCPSGRARSIQYQAPMRNVDSKIHAARFDCFKFLFHSFAAATFATKSALTNRIGMSALTVAMGVMRTQCAHYEPYRP